MANITRAEYDAKVAEITKNTADLKARGRKLRAWRRKFERQEGTYVPRAKRAETSEGGGYVTVGNKSTPQPTLTYEAYQGQLFRQLRELGVEFVPDEPIKTYKELGRSRKVWPSWWCKSLKELWLNDVSGEDFVQTFRDKWPDEEPDLCTLLDTTFPQIIGLRNSQKSSPVLQE